MSDSATATEPTEGGVSASGTGTTDPSGGMSDSATMGGGSGNETTTSGTGEESVGGSGGTTAMTTLPPLTTGDPIDCAAAMTKEECLALDCMPIEGQAFETDGAIWCLNDGASFLGCLEQAVCDDAIHYICEGQNIYQVPDGCFPNGYMICEPPTDPNLGFPSCM